MRFLFLLFFGLAVGAYAAVGQVSALNGQAVIERGDQRLSARVGLEIEEQDRVLTRAKSRLQLILADDTTINLGPESDLAIEEFLYHEEAANPRVKLRATRGTFRAITGQVSRIAPQNFTMQTKTATIGIRGTHFQGALGESEAIGCTRGTIGVRGEDGTEVLVRAGQMTTIAPGQPPSAPKALVLEELESQDESQGDEQDGDQASDEGETTEDQEQIPEEDDTVLTGQLLTSDGQATEEINAQVADAIALVNTQESNTKSLTTQLRDTSWALSSQWYCEDVEVACVFESRYFGQSKEALRVPGDSASVGHTLYEEFDGYRVSGVQPDDSIYPGEDGFEAELFAADDNNQFVINLHHRTNLEGEALHSDFFFAYEGIATARDQLKEDSVLTWDMLAWGVQGVGSDNTPEYAEIDVFMPHEHPRSDRPLVAVNTANNQALMLHPDGISIGQLGSASDNQAVLSVTDYSVLSQEPSVLSGDYSGALFGAEAQGFGMQGENTLPDGVTEQFNGGGYASTVEGLSDTVAKNSEGFSLEGHIASSSGITGPLLLDVTDRATGAMSATFSGDLAYAFEGINSENSAAYISDDFFGMTASSENTEGYLAALPTGPLSDFVSWGVWDVVDSTSTPTLTGGLWVAGREQADASQHIQDILSGSGGPQTYTYNGRVMGTSSASGDILMNENNTLALTFDFSQGMITAGSVSFDTQQSTGWSGEVDSGGVDGGTFNGTFVEGGGLQGTFYGSEAQAIGGLFNLSKENDSASGVFKAVR